MFFSNQEPQAFNRMIGILEKLTLGQVITVYTRYQHKGIDTISYADIHFNLSRVFNRNLKTEEVNSFIVSVNRKYKELMRVESNDTKRTLERFTCCVLIWLHEAILRKALTFVPVSFVPEKPPAHLQTNDNAKSHYDNIYALINEYFQKNHPDLDFSVYFSVSVKPKDKPKP